MFLHELSVDSVKVNGLDLGLRGSMGEVHLVIEHFEL